VLQRFVYLGMFMAISSSFGIRSNAASAPIVSDMSYISPDRLVDIGGRRLNIHCVGQGSPTVIFEAGLGDQMRAWAMVQPAVGAKTQACSYDRAGLGFSDPSDRPGTSENAVDDLHRLLAAASVKPPYILVGHSLGGMYMRLYADRYRSEVVGMVLVDPVSEEQGSRYGDLDPSTKSRNDKYVAAMRSECIPAAEKGFEIGSAIYHQCVGEPDPHFSAAFNEAFAANQATAAHLQAVWSEWSNVFTTSSDQVRAARQAFGDMPLVVLSRAPLPRGADETQEMRDAKNRLWMELHDNLARLSTRGNNQVVPGASHFIQLDEPGIVIDTIVREVRATSPHLIAAAP
jgi:pimeloyl-ACP methyl ester carboxylesterase